MTPHKEGEMPHETLTHDTCTLERTFRAPLSRLFAAWQTVEARAAWGAPSPDVTLRYRAANFTAGGEDVADCVVGGEVIFTVRTRWLDIVPERRVVSTETMSDPERVLGVCLVSAELLASGTGSRLVLTVQTVAFDGSDLPQGVLQGWTAALDHLAVWLSQAPAAPILVP